MTQWYTSKRSWIHESCVPTISILNLNLGFKRSNSYDIYCSQFFLELSVVFYFFGCGYMCDILRRSGNITLIFDVAAIVNVEGD